LASRAHKHIPGLNFADVVDSTQYGLSQISDYAIALAGELGQTGMIHKAIYAKPPADFASLWKADVGRWYASLPNPTPEQSAAAEEALRLLKPENLCPRKVQLSGHVTIF
jgi:hypothetical protein